MGPTILAAGLFLALGASGNDDIDDASWGDDIDGMHMERVYGRPERDEVLPGEVVEGEDGAPANLSPYRGPCSLEAPAVAKSRQKLRSLASLIRGLKPSDGLQGFRDAYRMLEQDPCFRDLNNHNFDFENRTAMEVKAWWDGGAERWLQSYLQLGPQPRYVILPPDLPRSVRASRELVSELMLCPEGASCEAGRAWRRKADAALNAAFGACETRPSERDCVVPQGRSLPGRYRDWLQCASERLSKRVELPIDPLRPPTEGWLTLRHVEPGVQRTCAATGIYSLASGDAWVLDGCGGGSLNAGRVPVGTVRELAVLLAIRGDIRTSLRTKAVEIALPLGLTPVWYEGVLGGVIGGLIGCRAGTHLPSPHIAWRVAGNEEEATGDHFDASYCDPTNRLIRTLADTVKAQFKPGCVSGSKPPPSTWAPLAQDNYADSVKEAERRDGQAFAALMRQNTPVCTPSTR